MRISNVMWVIVAAAFGISQPSMADEFYPARLNPRIFGTDQGFVGDCESEAEVSALESAFVQRGYDVRFSLFYRHAFNWAHPAQTPDWNMLKLDLNAADLALISQVGEMLPEYALPEATQGYSPYYTGVRPHISEMAVVDPTFPNTSAFGMSKSYFAWAQGYSNSVGFQSLKDQIKSGAPVVLQIHGGLLADAVGGLNFDHVTGLLKTPYTKERLLKGIQFMHPDHDVLTGLNHAVAAVAFDDSLYADQGYSVPGAVIIRNSWNDQSEVSGRVVNFTREQKEGLAKMKSKLHADFRIGYYAIPYQYFIDCINTTGKDGHMGIGGFEVFNVNYNAYAEAYLNYYKYYVVMKAPYACDQTYYGTLASTGARRTVKVFGEKWALAQSNGISPEVADKAYHFAENLATLEARNHRSNAGYRQRFKHATLSVNPTLGIDRVADFYNQKFSSYYCAQYEGTAKVWPYIEHYKNPVYRDALWELASGGDATFRWENVLESLYVIHAYDAGLPAPTPSPTPRPQDQHLF